MLEHKTVQDSPSSGKTKEAPRIHLRLPRWFIVGALYQGVSVILVVLILGAVGTVACLGTHAKPAEGFTEFYVLGAQGSAADYPQRLTLGQQGEVALGVVSHEHGDTSYYIKEMIDEEEILQIPPFGLAQGQKWQEQVTIVPSRAGENQKVEFLLYKGEASEPYLSLHIWIDAEEAEP